MQPRTWLQLRTSSPMVAAFVLLIYGIFIVANLDGRFGAAGFIEIGTGYITRSQASPAISAALHRYPAYERSQIGYDGQFFYYIALDARHAASYTDDPVYRYRRIGYPVTAWLLAFGQAAWIPYTLILVNLTCDRGRHLCRGVVVAALWPLTVARLAVWVVFRPLRGTARRYVRTPGLWTCCCCLAAVEPEPSPAWRLCRAGLWRRRVNARDSGNLSVGDWWLLALAPGGGTATPGRHAARAGIWPLRRMEGAAQSLVGGIGDQCRAAARINPVLWSLHLLAMASDAVAVY